MKKIIIILIILAVIGGAGFYYFKTDKKEPKYRTEKIVRGDITELVTAIGTVNPIVSTNVGAQVSGLIKRIYVDYNSPVRKGQLLAEIDSSTFEAQVAQARANLRSAQADLERIKSIAANDEKTYNRNKELYAQDFIPRSEVDAAEATFRADLAQIDAAEAQIQQARASLRNAETNLRYTKILSPVSGIVISKNVDVGQTVAASFQTPTLFLVAQDLTKMQINTNVSEADIGKIKEGQDVEYNVDGYPTLTFTGKVRQVRNSPTILQNVVTYDVVVSIDNDDLKLKPGMTANVSIITERRKNVLLVPNIALRFTPDKTKTYKTTGIWLLENEKPKRISVQVGISDGDNTEIKSKEAEAGQDVIVESLLQDKKAAQPRGGRGFRMF